MLEVMNNQTITILYMTFYHLAVRHNCQKTPYFIVNKSCIVII